VRDDLHQLGAQLGQPNEHGAQTPGILRMQLGEA
jgi:hypothetical protein